MRQKILISNFFINVVIKQIEKYHLRILLHACYLNYIQLRIYKYYLFNFKCQCSPYTKNLCTRDRSVLPELAPGTPADYYCHLLNPGGGWGKGHSIISPQFWSDKTNSSIKVAV